ncbi:unnamed protein product [Amoebophrya sp. A25]|nr:unnamed protein product [Amoebophrya sp. A25]|eukprot:GSA25T00017662001.1
MDTRLFNLRLDEILVQYDFDPGVRAQMENGQRKIFEDAENIWVEKLGVFTAESKPPLAECQRLLFFPRPSDMKIYATALRKRHPQDSKAHLTRLKLMTLFYSLHHGTTPLLEAFVSFGGLMMAGELMAYRKNAHIMSQATEIFQSALVLEPLTKLAGEIQQRQVQKAVDSKDLLFNHPLWPQLREVIFEGPFFDSITELLLDTSDVFPHSRSTALKLLGFVLQVICQPLLKPSIISQDESDKAGDEEWRNVRVPPKLYSRIVQLHEGGSLKPDEMDIALEMLNYLNDWDFDAEKAAAAREDAEEAAALERLYQDKLMKKMEQEAYGGASSSLTNKNDKSSAESSGKEASSLSTLQFIKDQLVSFDEVAPGDAAYQGDKGGDANSCVPSSSSSTKTSDKIEDLCKRDIENHLAAFKKMGNQCFKKQDYPDSRLCYEHAIAAKPGACDLVQAYRVYALQIPDEQTSKEVESEDPASIVSTWMKQHHLQHHEQTGSSFDFASWVRRSRPFHAEMSKIEANLAFSNLKLGNFSEAIAHAKTATLLEPSYGKAYYRLAEAYYNQTMAAMKGAGSIDRVDDQEDKENHDSAQLSESSEKAAAAAAISKALELEPKDKAIAELKKKIDGIAA